MYCPNCKNEYRKGIEICPQCNVDLVEELAEDIDFTELFRTEDEAMAAEVGRYFDHIDISYEITADEETAEFIFMVDKKALKKAKMEASTVIKVYSEKKALAAMESDEAEDSEASDEENTEEEAVIPERSNPYVSAKDRTSDYRSSGILFIIMGIIIVIVAVLNMLHIVNFIPAKMSQILMCVMGAGCVVLGISSVFRSKSLQKEVSGEEELVKNIKAAMAEKYPPMTFAEMMEDSDTTPELRYLQIQDEIKKTLSAEFPAASSEMLDEFIEEYTDSMFN